MTTDTELGDVRESVTEILYDDTVVQPVAEALRLIMRERPELSYAEAAAAVIDEGVDGWSVPAVWSGRAAEWRGLLVRELIGYVRQ